MQSQSSLIRLPSSTPATDLLFNPVKTNTDLDDFIFPFSHIIDNKEYIDAINDAYPSTDNKLGFATIYDLIFNPFDTKYGSLCANTDIDPDRNLFVDWTAEDCKYVTIEELRQVTEGQSAVNFSLLQVNCRSLYKNFDQLKLLLTLCAIRPTIISLSETWMKSGDERYFDMPGYTLYSSARETRGGGCAVYILSDISQKQRFDLDSVQIVGVFECLCLELVYESNVKFVVTSIYRPPNANIELFNTAIENYLIKLKPKKNVKLVLIGDFNLNLLDICTKPKVDDFFNIMLSHHMIPTVTRPTRIAGTSATLIDNVFINTLEYKYSSSVICDDLSDHFPVYVEFVVAGLPRLPVPLFKKRNFTNENLIGFYKRLQAIDWHLFCSGASCSTDPDALYNTFHEKFITDFNIAFPLESMTKFNNTKIKKLPWITPSIARCCRKKSRLLKRSKIQKSEMSRKRFIEYRNILKSTIRIAEQRYYHCQFEKYATNIRGTWKIINSIINKPVGKRLPKVFLVDGQECTSPTAIANAFNNFFTNIGPDLAAKIIPTTEVFTKYLPVANSKSMALFPTTELEIVNIINSFNKSSSPGMDNITASVVYFVRDIVALPLSCIINKALELGVFPDALKLARVVPIYKSGDASLLTNYRPISILPIFSKIYEKVIANRINVFIKRHDILYSGQYGFREKRSAYMAILEMTSKIMKAFEAKHPAIGIFIDLSKAFDTIDHAILLQKLSNCGIRGIVLKLLTSYLTGRNQCVSYNGSFSDTLPITCGVPQGSILGPLLFLLYINDVHACSDLLYFILFADDTNIFCTDTDWYRLCNIVNNELCKLDIWFRANRLSLNVAQTHYL